MSHQHWCCLVFLNTQMFFGQISVQKEDFYREKKTVVFLSDCIGGHKADGSRLSEKVGGRCRTLKSKLNSLIGNFSLTFENLYGWIKWKLYLKKESDASESC